MKALDAYLVGGAVRDRLLGRPVQDRDWVVVGSSVRQMKKRGFMQVGKDFPVFLHPQTKEEYALARTERKRGVGHRGFDVDANPSVTLEEDLRRRDLTINAIAEGKDGKLFDPFDGALDIERKKLRHVSEAFGEDPLRVFRVARFAAELPGFTVVPETVELMSAMCASGELKALPAERIWQEMKKALGAQSPQAFFGVLAQCGGLGDWLPELEERTLDFTAGDAVDRFSELQLDADEQKSLGIRLKVPREFRSAAEHYRRLRGTIEEWRTVASEELLDAFGVLKVVHQTDSLERLIDLIDRHLPAAALDKEGLLSLAAGMTEISVAQSLEGAEHGEALRAARLEWLDAQRSR